MKTWITLLALIVLLFLLARWAVKKVSPPPEALYSGSGQLTECPASPNCVSTLNTDPEHAIAAINGDPQTTFDSLKQRITATENARIVTEKVGYLHAEYRSRLMGFVDDLEILVDPETATLQIRSASRLGHSDLGVNRSRVESLLKSL